MGIDLKKFLIGVNAIANPFLCYILHRKHRKMADELPDDFDVIVLGTGMLYDYKLSNFVNLISIKFKSFRDLQFKLCSHSFESNYDTVILALFKLKLILFPDFQILIGKPLHFEPIILTLIPLKNTFYIRNLTILFVLAVGEKGFNCTLLNIAD